MFSIVSEPPFGTGPPVDALIAKRTQETLLVNPGVVGSLGGVSKLRMPPKKGGGFPLVSIQKGPIN